MTTFLDDFVKGFTKNQLIAYFLMLWAATFFFSAINGFVYIADGYRSIITVVVELFWSLADLGCAGILVLLGVKILNSQQEDKPE